MSAQRRCLLLVSAFFVLGAPPTYGEPQAVKASAAFTDHYGDPLPEGAIARLGTVRFRHPDMYIAGSAISPDGKVVVTAGDRATPLHFWDLKTGKELHRVEGKESCNEVAYSSSGKFLATGTWDESGNVKSVVLRDGVTGKEVRRLEGRANDIEGLAFTDGDKQLVAVEIDGTVRWWDAATGKRLRAIKVAGVPPSPGAKGPILGGLQNARFSADGGLLLAIAAWPKLAGEEDDGTDIHRGPVIWDLRTHKELWRGWGDWKESIAAALSADGRLIAAGTGPRDVSLRDAATGKELHRLAGPKDDELLDVLAFSPDGKTLAASGYPSNKVRLWNSATGKLIREWSTSASLEGSAHRLTFTPDGRALLAEDQAMALYDVATGKDLLPWEGHNRAVTHLLFSADGSRLVTGTIGYPGFPFSYPERAIAWETAGWKAVFRSTAEDPLKGLTTSPDHSLRVGRTPGNFDVYERAGDKKLRSFTGKYTNLTGLAACGQFSSDNRLLAMPTGDDKSAVMLLFDIRSGLFLGTIPRTHHSTELAFSRDDKFVAWYGDLAAGIYLAEVDGGKQRPVAFKPAPDELRSSTTATALAFSSDSQFLASLDNADNDIHVWRVATGEEHVRLPRKKSAWHVCLAWSPDGRLLAVSTAAGNGIDIWEVATGRIRRTLAQHAGQIEALAFSPAGRLLASGSVDATVLIWDVYSSTGKYRLPPTTEQLAALWTDLGVADAARAGATLAELVSYPDKSVPLLREKLARAVAPDPALLKRHLADLESDDFTLREKASRALENLGDLAAPGLKELRGGKSGAEQKKRVDELLEKLHDGRLTSAAVLRGLRGVETLETIGTPEARRVLEDLAKGASETRQTREAKAALDRLSGRKAKP